MIRQNESISARLETDGTLILTPKKILFDTPVPMQNTVPYAYNRTIITQLPRIVTVT
jgi:hypothetical protein